MQERDLKTIKFMKRFQGKMRYINKETGLLGALFPNTNIENVQTNRASSSKHQIIELITQAKRTKKSCNKQKIRSYRQHTENSQNIRQSISKISKSQITRKRTIMLPPIHANIEDKEKSEDKNIRSSYSSSHSQNSGRRRSVNVRIR